jgi:protein tyrosine phosphatase
MNTNPLQPPKLDLSGFLAPSSLLPDSPMSAGGPKPGAHLSTLTSTALDAKILPAWLDRIAAKGPIQTPLYLERLFQAINELEKQHLRQGSSSASQDPSYPNPFAMKASSERGNLRRNRYTDIIPYDSHRVRLLRPSPIITAAASTTGGHPTRTSDYINASHLDTALDYPFATPQTMDGFGHYKGQKYISTQGPLAETVGDFWGMIWDQNVHVIVMLTKEEERGRLKCHRYWPDRIITPMSSTVTSSTSTASTLTPVPFPTSASSNSSPISSTVIRCNYGSEELEIRLVQQKSVSNGEVILREFKVSRGKPKASNHQTAMSSVSDTEMKAGLESPMENSASETRTVWHVHYLEWPDHKSSNAHSVLSVIDLARSLQNANPSAGPMVVHCSAGCGRTGTFCTIDSVLDQLETGVFLNTNGGENHADTASPSFDSPSSGSTSTPLSFKAPTVIEFPTTIDESDRDDPVVSTVLKLRLQRINMVQTLEQFAFCYEAVVTRMVDWAVENRPISWTPVPQPSPRPPVLSIAEVNPKSAGGWAKTTATTAAEKSPGVPATPLIPPTPGPSGVAFDWDAALKKATGKDL